MRKRQTLTGMFITACMAGTLMLGQQAQSDRVTVPFSNPSRPGFLEARVHNGGITVKGYEGKEVIIEARVREHSLTEALDTPEKGKDLRRIRVMAGTGLEVEEKDNIMEVGVSSLKQTVDLVIQVPYNTSLELSSHNNGDIVVERVKGEVEVNNHNGKLILTAISGSVVANTFNGGIRVTFEEVNPGKPMSFTTWDGDIDITFPPTIKAKVKMNSELGDAFSDFDIQIDPTPQKVMEDERKEGGKFKISFDKYIIGKINGGGPEYTFKTYNGDILIRKGK